MAILARRLNRSKIAVRAPVQCTAVLVIGGLRQIVRFLVEEDSSTAHEKSKNEATVVVACVQSFRKRVCATPILVLKTAE
jgi:hypothetical protein